ncbi:MAG: hypothetical protein ABW318_27180 [Vicinamibacterales bacterium]
MLVSVHVALVHRRVVTDVGLRKGAKCDVGLSANLVPTFEYAAALFRFDRLRQLLVRGLGRLPIPLLVHAKVIEPMVLALGR